MRAESLTKINAIAELERCDWNYEPQGENEIRIRCPVHDDKNPSASLNVSTNKWICHTSGCEGRGDIVSLLALIQKVERGVMLIDLSSRYDLENAKQINPSRVEKFHELIKTAGPLLTALRKRGITDEMIRDARLGFHANRITIPIFDSQKRCVNIRRYLPGGPSKIKMRNTTGYSKPRVYQVEQFLKYEQVWICGGEMKALVAGALLTPHGVGACAVTAAEGTWDSKWNPIVKNKYIFICMDVDHAGKIAARKLAAQLRVHAKWVGIIKLPLDREKYPKGDLNDFVGVEKANARDLLDLMEVAEEYQAEEFERSSDLNAAAISLENVTQPNNVGRRLSFEAIIAAEDTTPFLVPSKARVFCDRQQSNCAICPISTAEPDKDTLTVDLDIRPTAAGILEMLDAPKARQQDGIRTSLGIPPCKKVQFLPLSHFRVSDCRLSPQLSISSQSTGNTVQPAYIVDKQIELNTPYEMEGVCFPHPANQQAVLLVDNTTETVDNLSSFSPTVEDLKELEIFRPRKWTVESVEQKLKHIYDDLSTNVTGIYGRQDLHLAIDLAFHSALVFEFDKEEATGWTNILILGDSGQGKTKTCVELNKHYGVGERAEAKNSTVAGLLGGLQQLGTRWFVSWGTIPTHDRRLVILEEIKGADPEVIAKLTDMRSSGIAELQKIERRRAHARTRLIMTSNSRSGRQISAYAFGCEAIKELIVGLEDIRRFDLVIIVAAEQVDVDQINVSHSNRAELKHVYTGDLCRRLILWSWTRRPDQVDFEIGTVKAVLEASVDLCNDFSEALPLVDRGTMRFKLARLAVALAVRTYSTVSGDVILVRPCHVQVVAQYLRRMYSDPVFGYLDFSKAQTRQDSVVDPEVVRRQLVGTRYPADLIKQLLSRDEIMPVDVEDWCEVESDVAKKLVALLVRKHCLFRRKRHYIKSAKFIALLKELELEKIENVVHVDGGDPF